MTVKKLIERAIAATRALDYVRADRLPAAHAYDLQMLREALREVKTAPERPMTATEVQSIRDAYGPSTGPSALAHNAGPFSSPTLRVGAASPVLRPAMPSLYPWMVVQRGAVEPRYFAFNTNTAKRGFDRKTYAEAADDAMQFKNGGGQLRWTQEYAPDLGLLGTSHFKSAPFDDQRTLGTRRLLASRHSVIGDGRRIGAADRRAS